MRGTCWQVSSRAVQVKIPEMVCAAGVMRKMGVSGVTTGVSHDLLRPPGATVTTPGPGTMPTRESFPERSDRDKPLLHSRAICGREPIRTRQTHQGEELILVFFYLECCEISYFFCYLSKCESQKYICGTLPFTTLQVNPNMTTSAAEKPRNEKKVQVHECFTSECFFKTLT